MGIVHHHSGAKFPGQSHNLRQVGNISSHREHAVCDNQAAAALRNLLQLPPQVPHIVVPVAEHLAVAQLAAVVNTGVIFPVTDDVVMESNQSADDSQITLKPGGEGHHGLLMEELPQLRLQLQVHLQGPIEKSGTGAAGSIPFQGMNPSLYNLGICCQAQVVVGAEHDAALALHHDLGVLS